MLEGEVFSAEDVSSAWRTDGECVDVGFGDFGYIDEIEAGVHVCGKFAVEEVDEDAACGCGLGIVGADGGCWIQNDNFLSGMRSINGLLLGEELGTLIVADHVGERDWSVLVDDDTVSAEVHGGDGGGVDDAADIGFAGGAEEIAGAINVGAVHGVGVANPEAVIGGYVEDGFAALQG